MLAVAAMVWSEVAGPNQPVAAFGTGGVVPEVGLWCGMTDDGGSVRLTVTSDGRFVTDISIRSTRGSIESDEGWGGGEAQVKSGMFIWKASSRSEAPSEGPGAQPRPQPRQPGSPGRCTTAPCRPISASPPGGSRTSPEVTVRQATVRGEFETPDSLSGSFSGLEQVTGGTSRPKTTSLNGQYVAWPAWVAPCP
jgi:hypothetical protein